MGARRSPRLSSDRATGSGDDMGLGPNTLFDPVVLGSLICLSAAVKTMMVAAYRSTDFEVHRNWMAITATLPPDKWYFDETSKWTLDYPPLFAWFEKVLSWGAPLFDSQMLVLENLNYASPQTVLYQRATVVATELVLVFAVAHYFRSTHFRAIFFAQSSARDASTAGMVLAVINAGLFITDHVHFQYNAMLLGLLVLSVSLVANGRDLAGGILFAVLVNMKHLFLCLGPAYFVFLLQHHCIHPPRGHWVSGEGFGGFATRLGMMGAAVAGVFAISFGPFVALGGMEQLWQILRRLFPFGRGLCHAYWAPNVWVAYNILDKIAVKLLGTSPHVGAATATMTGGLVGDAQHVRLPAITPGMTVVLSLSAMFPALWAVWTARNPRGSFVLLIVYCSLAAFLFGFHVHEKAALMASVPLVLVAAESPEHAQLYRLLSNVAHAQLLPLLFQPQEWVLRLAVWGIHAAVSALLLPAGELRPPQRSAWRRLLHGARWWYQVGLVLVPEAVAGAQPLLLPGLPFLPLLVRSVFCLPGMLLATYECLRLLTRSCEGRAP